VLAKARCKFKFGLTLTKVCPAENDFVSISETQTVFPRILSPHLSYAQETEVYSSTKEAKTTAMIYSQTVPFTCNKT